MNDTFRRFDQRSLLVIILSIIFVVAIILGFTQIEKDDEISLTLDSPPPAPSIVRQSDAAEVSAQVETNEKLMINSASVSEIAERLKGIGPRIAQSIVDYREANGPYQSLEQLQEVRGVGFSKTENNRGIISFEILD